MSNSEYYSVCNDTKWKELRACILSFERARWPKFRSKCLTNGYISAWDREWSHHFIEGGFKDIEWFELRLRQFDDRELIDELLKIGLVGKCQENVIRLYVYVPNGFFLSKLTKEDFGEDQVQHHV